MLQSLIAVQPRNSAERTLSNGNDLWDLPQWTFRNLRD